MLVQRGAQRARLTPKTSGARARKPMTLRGARDGAWLRAACPVVPHASTWP